MLELQINKIHRHGQILNIGKNGHLTGINKNSEIRREIVVAHENENEMPKFPCANTISLQISECSLMPVKCPFLGKCHSYLNIQKILPKDHFWQISQLRAFPKHHQIL